MKPVIAEFILNPHQDKHTAGHPHYQAGDIDDGKEFVLENITKTNLKIISQHNCPPVNGMNDKSWQGCKKLSPAPTPSWNLPFFFQKIPVYLFKILGKIDLIVIWEDMLYQPYSKQRRIFLFISHCYFEVLYALSENPSQACSFTSLISANALKVCLVR